MSNNIRINEIPSGERPREKLLFYGVEYLSTEALFHYILRPASRELKVVQ